MNTIRALLLALLLLALVLSAIFLPVEQLITGIQQWAAENASTAFVAVTAGIILGMLLLLPLVMLLPYPMLNYSLGLTSVSLRDYALATAIGSIPAFFLFVYLGTTVSDIAAVINGDIHLEGTELLIAIAALTAVTGLVLLIVRIAGKVLREELAAARE